MRPYCEEVTSSILPAIRSSLTRELINIYKFTQKETADLLDITQPAVSQYMKETRGFRAKKLQKDKEVMKMIDILAKDIANERLNPDEIQERVCKICRNVKGKEDLLGC